MITGAAVKAGFGAGLLEDDPDTKNQKLYLVLTVGSGGDLSGRDITDSVRRMEGVEILDERKRHTVSGRKRESTKQWIMRKKERDRRKGKVVKKDSKYTGRKRRIAF
jgi:18S rRNA (guanine1575-N7)-methyltransferase